MTRIVIQGFGRIGRSTLRAALRDGDYTPVALSEVQDPDTLAALFAVDSNYGRWPEPVRAEGDTLRIGERAIPYYNVRQGLPDWGALGVDLVIDCTGRATAYRLMCRWIGWATLCRTPIFPLGRSAARGVNRIIAERDGAAEEY